MKYFLALATVLVAATTLKEASAQKQPWIADRRYGEGMGIRAGDLELHPGISGEFGYDSNYFQRAPSEDVASALRLRIAPQLTLSTLSAERRGVGGAGAPPTVNFQAGLAASYNEFFATDSRFSKDLSQQRNIEGGANLKLDILPERPWGADIYAGFSRVVDPSNSAILDSAFDRDTIVVGPGINWRPGGGMFEWRLGYEYTYNLFERQAFKSLNNSQHQVETKGRWRFFPRTAVLYDAEYAYTTYESSTTQNDGDALRARMGLNGLVTNRFSLLAMLGWAQSYYERSVAPPQNYDNLIAHGELKFFVLPQAALDPTAATVGLSSIALGYTRDFRNSYLGDFTQNDRGYLTLEYFAAGTVLLSLQGGVAQVAYPRSLVAPAFSETRADATLFGEYRLSETLAMNGTLRYDANLSDSVVRLDPANAAAVDNLKFSRFQAWLGLRWFM